MMKMIVLALSLGLFACNDGDKKTEKANTEDVATDKEAQKKGLNERSRACIALMNSLEVEMKAARAAGDSEAAAALEQRIDSAARENVKIGQQLMELDRE